MPNWATGTLKLKGSKEEIVKFCKDILSERGASFKANENQKYRTVEWKLDDEGVNATYYGYPDLLIWLKDSNRNFIDMDTEIPYYWDFEAKELGEAKIYKYKTTFVFYDLPKNKDGTRDHVIVFPFKSAWGLREDYFEELSKKYKLEFRLYVVEKGMGFYEGYIFKDGETTITDSGPNKGNVGDGIYGQFIWECPFPFIGG